MYLTRCVGIFISRIGSSDSSILKVKLNLGRFAARNNRVTLKKVQMASLIVLTMSGPKLKEQGDGIKSLKISHTVRFSQARFNAIRKIVVLR